MLVQTVAALHRVGGRGLVREVREAFMVAAPALLATTQAHARAGEFADAAQGARALQSHAAQLGAVRLQRICREAEECALAGQRRGLSSALARAAHELDRFQTRLKEATNRMNAATAKPRVLLVEDNPDNRQLIRAMLADEYEVLECASGAEALAVLSGHMVDLVFMDISMPGMDGLETLSRWRADPSLPQVPVVAVSAHAMTGDRERFLARGFDAYVSKPITADRDVLDLAAQLLKASR